LNQAREADILLPKREHATKSLKISLSSHEFSLVMIHYYGRRSKKALTTIPALSLELVSGVGLTQTPINGVSQ